MAICIARNTIVYNISWVIRDAFQLDKQLCFALHATSRAVTQAYGPLLAPLGVTYPQYLVLLVLWEGDGLTVSDIGDRLYLDSGTVTPLLKRIEAAGLLRRARDADDERIVRISLTTQGRKLRGRAENIADGVACALGIGAVEIAAIREPLRKILFRYRSQQPQQPAKPSARKNRKQSPR